MRKTTIGVAALVALAFAALPAVAAATPHITGFKNENTHFTVQSGAGETAVLATAGGTKVTCKEEGGVPAVTGTGVFEKGADGSYETGSVKFTFHNCRESAFSSTCTGTNPETGESEPSGTISTTTLPFHLKTTTGNSTPAVLLTPGKEGAFAHFHCLSGALKVTVKGNGIVGEITSGYKKSSTFTTSFKTNAGKQTPEEVDETSGTKYHLESSLNGGAYEYATETAGGTGTFTEGEPELTKT